ncbi:MAG: AraC family transcriptional regulator [Rhizobacter sp.]
MTRSTLLALGPRSLYIGPAFGLTAHTNTVSVLACGLDGLFTAASGDDGAARTCRSAFIPAHTLHQLECGSTTMAFLYVDALGLDDQRLRHTAALGTQAIAFSLPGESELIALLARLAEPGDQRVALWGELLDLLETHHEKHGDERIRRSVTRLARDPSAANSLADLAAEVNLSESRYLHLFKTTTGVPLRRYRLWIRIGAAIRAIARGKNLTEAAIDAGFSSSAHFSFTFREMFGMAPSTLAGIGVQYARLPTREA